MEEVNKPRSLIDDRPLTPTECRKLLRGESIWGTLEVPRLREDSRSGAQKPVAV